MTVKIRDLKVVRQYLVNDINLLVEVDLTKKKMSFVELDETKNLVGTLENIVIDALHSNFAGAPSAYNNPGDRFFYVTLSDEVAEKMVEEGWNVRAHHVDGEMKKYLKVSAGKEFDPLSGQLLLNSWNEDWKYINDGDTIEIVGVYWHIPTRNNLSGVKAYFNKIKR